MKKALVIGFVTLMTTVGCASNSPNIALPTVQSQAKSEQHIQSNTVGDFSVKGAIQDGSLAARCKWQGDEASCRQLRYRRVWRAVRYYTTAKNYSRR